MLLQFNKLKMILLIICFVLSPFFCFGQGEVKKSAPNDTREHLLNLDTNKLLHFNVSASDGKMSRIDAVSDSGSSWDSDGLETSTAVFWGVPNSGKSGTFKPRFSGVVRLSGNSGSGEPETYGWTAKAKYKLTGKLKIELIPGAMHDFLNRDLTSLGLHETGFIKVFDENNINITVNVVLSVEGDNVLQLRDYNYFGESVPYSALGKPGEVDIIATDSLNNQSHYPVSVIEPTTMFMKKIPNTKISHVYDTASAGCVLMVCFEPSTVSFYGLKIREWGEKPDGTSLYHGSGEPFNDIIETPTIHNASPWAVMNQQACSLNCVKCGYPNVYDCDILYYHSKVNPNPKFSLGGKYSEDGEAWIILPWQFETDGKPKTILNVLSHAEATKNGKMTAKKGGETVSANALDATQKTGHASGL
jgi:hypothetical protein